MKSSMESIETSPQVQAGVQGDLRKLPISLRSRKLSFSHYLHAMTAHRTSVVVHDDAAEMLEAMEVAGGVAGSSLKYAATGALVRVKYSTSHFYFRGS